MFTDRKPLGLKLTVGLGILNSVIAMAGFVLTSRGKLAVTGLGDNLWVYGTVMTIFAVIPVIYGIYGLYHRKMWGLGYFTFGSGVFAGLAGSAVLFMFTHSNYGVIFYASIYLVLYTLLANVYTWTFRHQFNNF